MDKHAWKLKWEVNPADIAEIEIWAEEAIRRLALAGTHKGVFGSDRLLEDTVWDVTLPDLVVIDALGRVMEVATDTVDLSQDENSNPTVPPASQSRWIVVAVEYEINETNSQTDPIAGTPFNFHHLDSYKVRVVMGAASGGTPTPPTVGDAIIVGGIIRTDVMAGAAQADLDAGEDELLNTLKIMWRGALGLYDPEYLEADLGSLSGVETLQHLMSVISGKIKTNEDGLAAHDHDGGDGSPIPTGGILDDAVTKEKINADVAGNGLTQAGTGALQVNVDDVGLQIVSDELRIKADGVTTTKIQDDNVTGAKLAPAVAGAGLVQDGGGNLDVNPAGGLEISGDAVQVADDGVTAAKLNADTAGNGLVQEGSGALGVNVDDASLQIVSDELRIKADGVTTTKIQDDNVTGAKLAPAVAGNGLVQDGSGNLVVDADDSTLIVDGASLRIKDDGVTGSKLAPAVAGEALGQDGSGNLDVKVDDVGIEIFSDALRLKDDGVKPSHIDAAVAGLGLTQGTGGTLNVEVDDLTIGIVSDTLEAKGIVARWAAGCYVDMGVGVLTAIEIAGGNIVGRSGNAVKGAATAVNFGFAYGAGTGRTIITAPTGTDIEDYIINITAVASDSVISVLQASSTTWEVRTYSVIGAAAADADYHFQALRVT